MNGIVVLIVLLVSFYNIISFYYSARRFEQIGNTIFCDLREIICLIIEIQKFEAN